MNSRFIIPNPCAKNWADLRGEGPRRHCATCQTDVHAIEQYSSAEWKRVVAESNGHVCGMLAGESLEQPRSRRVVLVGALLTAISPLMAQSGRVRFRVTDVTGAVVPHAGVSLLGPDDATIKTQMADLVGETIWFDLPMGDSRFTIFCAAFKRRPVTVTVRNSDEEKIEVVLEVGSITVGGAVPEVPTKKSPLPTAIPDSAPLPTPKPAKRRHRLIFHY